MRAYHPSKRRPFPTIPVQAQRLPINLLRTDIYPGRPEVVGNAVEAWQRYMAGQPMPTLLPQRMAFQQWKTTPSNQRKWWASSAQSYMALSGQYYRKSGVPTRVATRILAGHGHPPYYPMYQAGAQLGGAYPGHGSAGIPDVERVLTRSMPRHPTADVLAGQRHVAAPFPRPEQFIETLQARTARAVYQKIQRRNQAEQGARTAIATREGWGR